MKSRKRPGLPMFKTVPQPHLDTEYRPMLTIGEIPTGLQPAETCRDEAACRNS